MLLYYQLSLGIDTVLQDHPAYSVRVWHTLLCSVMLPKQISKRRSRCEHSTRTLRNIVMRVKKITPKLPFGHCELNHSFFDEACSTSVHELLLCLKTQTMLSIFLIYIYILYWERSMGSSCGIVRSEQWRQRRCFGSQQCNIKRDSMTFAHLFKSNDI